VSASVSGWVPLNFQCLEKVGTGTTPCCFIRSLTHSLTLVKATTLWAEHSFFPLRSCKVRLFHFFNRKKWSQPFVVAA